MQCPTLERRARANELPSPREAPTEARVITEEIDVTLVAGVEKDGLATLPLVDIQRVPLFVRVHVDETEMINVLLDGLELPASIVAHAILRMAESVQSTVSQSARARCWTQREEQTDEQTES